MPAGVQHGQPAPGMPNIHAQQRNAALEHQLAQRRSRKPNDRNMPEGVEDLVIGEGVQQYKDLRDVERKLDYTMMRKRLDIQDSIHRNVKRHKTMRIWISNTADNQPWQAERRNGQQTGQATPETIITFLQVDISGIRKSKGNANGGHDADRVEKASRRCGF
jgi:hypothetical protein